MDIIANTDLLSVAIAISGIGLLGTVIYFHEPESVTARTFLGFAVVTILWSIANYLQYQPTGEQLGLSLIRFITFLGCWHAFLFFQLCIVFPQGRFAFPHWYVPVMLLGTGSVSLLTLTPLVFSAAKTVTETGIVTAVAPGPGMPLFVLFAAGLVFAGIITLVRNLRHSGSGIERKRFIVVTAGFAITFALIIAFNLLLPAFFNNPRFLPLSSVFVFPFIASIAFALVRYELFSVKVIATESFAFLLTVATAIQVLFSGSGPALVFHASTFFLTLAFSILLVQSVMKEVKLREKIEAQEKQLAAINQQQTALLHFISHEVKGSLNKAQGVFAGLVEGDYGALPESARTIAFGALTEVAKGIAMVMDILAASDMKKGTVSYDMKPFDCVRAVEELVDSERPFARERGLHLEFLKPASGTIMLEGDGPKLAKHVFRNLIENAIRYTPAGSVRVSLARAGSIARFSVEDTGVGITPSDMAHLFQEGGHGKDSRAINVDSTGFGLYIAKQVVEAHHGRIWAESEGAGKGARFVVELPSS